jgi:hypothetical protein
VRRYELRSAARSGFHLLDGAERAAVSAVIAGMMDERVPLVGAHDFAITHGSSIMGRAVPGTNLVVCYVPAGDEVFVVNIRRR